MNTYALVNPMIVGTMKMTVNAPNSSSAAIELYNRISPYFASVQPNFIFSIQKLKGGNQVGGGNNNSYHSFRVKEVEKNGEVVFIISTYSGNVKLGNLKSSINRVQERLNSNIDLADSEKSNNNTKADKQIQNGGKNKRRHTDDDDDDDDDVYDKLLSDLDEEEDSIFPKRKGSRMNLVAPHGLNYITELAVPYLVDPIQYYWYNPIVYEVPKIVVPTFISTIMPHVVIDLGF